MTPLGRVIPAIPAIGPAHGPDLRIVAPALVGYRFAAVDRTVLVVLDVDSGEVLHQAVVTASPEGVAFDVAGIAFVDGSTLQLVRGSAVTALDTGAVASPAIHPADDDGGKAVVYWTAAGQPRSSELAAP